MAEKGLAMRDYVSSWRFLTQLTFYISRSICTNISFSKAHDGPIFVSDRDVIRSLGDVGAGH